MIIHQFKCRDYIFNLLHSIAKTTKKHDLSPFAASLYLCICLADKIRSISKYYIKFVHLDGYNKKKRYFCSVDSQ